MKKLLYFGVLLFSCFPLFGQATTGYHRVSQVIARSNSGTTALVVPFAKIAVTNTATGNAAVIYFDPLLSSQITPPLITADLAGNYSYYMPLNTCVTETISSPGQSNIVIPNICGNPASSVLLETNGVNNAQQNLLNLVAGVGIVLSNTGGAVTINAQAGSGVTSINTVPGAFTFSGSAVSCTGTTCIFTGGGGGGSTDILTNSVDNTLQTILNFTNGNGFVFSNPSGGVEKVGVDGTHYLPLNTSGTSCFWNGGGTCTTPVSGVSSVTGAAGNRADLITPTTGAVVVTNFDQQLYASQFATIPLLITACGAANTKITVDTAQSFTLAANQTFPTNCAFNFTQEGVWTVGGAFTLTLGPSIVASPSLHFAGAATISGLSGSARPEWWGAVPYSSVAAAAAGPNDVAKAQLVFTALTGGGYMELQCSYYHIGGLVISQSLRGVLGDCPAGFDQSGVGITSPPAATIVSSSASETILAATGTPSVPLQYIAMKNFALQRSVLPTGSARGLSLESLDIPVIEGVSSADSRDLVYAHFAGNNGLMDKITGVWGLSVVSGASYTTGSVHMFNFDSADGLGEHTITVTNSTSVCALIPSVVSTGLLASGLDISDMLIQDLRTGSCSYGIDLESPGTTSSLAQDIKITDSVLNASTISAIKINNVLGSANLAGTDIQVTGTDLQSANGTSCVVDIENSRGIVFSGGNHFFAEIPTCINGSKDIGISGNVFNFGALFSVPVISGVGSSTVSITGNTFISDATSIIPGAAAISLASTSVNWSISGNTFSNQFINAILCDGTSGTNVVGSNAYDPLITTPVSGCGNSSLFLNLAGGYTAPSGGSATVIQVNGTPTSTATPVNLQNSSTNTTGLALTVSNPSVGNVKSEITGTVNIASGGTGASTAAAHTVFGNSSGSTAAPAFTATPVLTSVTVGNNLFNTTGINTSGNDFTFAISSANLFLAATSSATNVQIQAGNTLTLGALSGCLAADATTHIVSGTGSACGSGGSTAFSALTTSTNTTATMTVGTGATLLTSGSGSIIATNAVSLSGGTLGEVPYQISTGNTNFTSAPVTSGHTFMLGWLPVGSAIAPSVIDLGAQTANTVLGSLTATTPSVLAVPSCSGATNALIWTSGTGFGCNTITGGVSSVSNSDGTLTISPTTGAVVASIALAHANTWLSVQTFPSPAFTGTVTGANTIPLSILAQSGANTMLGNWTSGTANVVANAMPSCSTSASALNYTTSTGIGCNTAINAAQLGGQTFASPAAIGTGTPAAGTFTNVTDSALTAGQQVVAGTSGILANGGTAILSCADTSASGTAQTCTTSPSFTPAAKSCIIYTTTTANTGAGLTLNVNSLGAKSVSKWMGSTTTLAANDVLANKDTLACYDGTTWELSDIGNAPSGSGGVTWDAIGTPVGSLALTFPNADTTTLTAGSATSTANFFNLVDTAANTGTGDLLRVSTNTTSAMQPFEVLAKTVSAFKVLATGESGATGKMFVNAASNVQGSGLYVGAAGAYIQGTSSLVNSSAGATAAVLSLINSGSPTNNSATSVTFQAVNSAFTFKAFASITGTAVSVTNTTEIGSLVLSILNSGSTVNALTLSGAGNGLFVGTVTSALGNAAITSATGATGVTSVTCQTAACNVSRGSYTVVGGTATTGTIVTLVWPTTTTAWVCSADMNGGTGFLGIGHSVATATGMTITAGITVVGTTFTFDYNCVP